MADSVKPKQPEDAAKPLSKTQQKKQEHIRRMKLKKEGGGKDAKPMSAYKRAEKQFDKIQQERKHQREERKKIEERREQEKLDALTLRRKKDQSVKMRTRKGQPNLNAVMDCIVEKLMRQKGRQARSKPAEE